MPNLLSRSKHEEFESNSALQIRNQKERRAKEIKKMKCRKFWQAANISQPSKFSQDAKFSHPAKVAPTFVIFLPF